MSFASFRLKCNLLVAIAVLLTICHHVVQPGTVGGYAAFHQRRPAQVARRWRLYDKDGDGKVAGQSWISSRA